MKIEIPAFLMEIYVKIKDYLAAMVKALTNRILDDAIETEAE